MHPARVALFVTVLLVGCSSSQQQTENIAGKQNPEAKIVYDSIHQPLDKAKDVERQLLDAAQQQRAQIEQQ